MTRRSGSADLPLHGGRVPRWLADRMTRLGALMAEAIVHEYGRDEFLRRLAHPFWFQSFGAVMGMDWHSSGITTSVIGALKRGLTPLGGELGIHVCGGRGKHSRATPGELVAIGQRVGFDGGALATASRLVAKVDSAAVQDGFDLYLHGFIVSDDGRWVVVQQGMNDERRQARRYHWLSENLKSFVDDPHAAVDGPGQGRIVNLADRRAQASRLAQLDLLQSVGPDGIAREFARIDARPSPAPPTDVPLQLGLLPHLTMPEHHDVRSSDVVTRRLHGALAAAAENGQAISPSCCRCRALARAPCARWRWSPRWCMARRAGSAIRRASRWRTAARTAIHSRCPRASTTTPSACSNPRWKTPSSVAMSNWPPSSAWTNRPVGWNGMSKGHRSSSTSPRSGSVRTSTVGAACSAGSHRRRRRCRWRERSGFLMLPANDKGPVRL